MFAVVKYTNSSNANGVAFKIVNVHYNFDNAKIIAFELAQKEFGHFNIEYCATKNPSTCEVMSSILTYSSKKYENTTLNEKEYYAVVFVPECEQSLKLQML